MIDKWLKLHAKITNQKQQLLTYQPKPTKAPKKIKEITPKDLALVQWQIEIQKQRGLMLEQILAF